MKREKRLIITLSTDEYRLIQEAAAKDGRPVASYLRHAALERAKTTAKGMPAEGNAGEGNTLEGKLKAS